MNFHFPQLSIRICFLLMLNISFVFSTSGLGMNPEYEDLLDLGSESSSPKERKRLKRKSAINNTQFMGYQAVNESLQWLRTKLSGTVITPHMNLQIVDKMDNSQPSSYCRYDKTMEKVQRLNGFGSEEINHLL